MSAGALRPVVWGGGLGALVGGRGAAMVPLPLLAWGRGRGAGCDGAVFAGLGAAVQLDEAQQ